MSFVLETLSRTAKPRMILRRVEFDALLHAAGYDSDTSVATFLGVPRSVIWKLRHGGQRPSADFIAVVKVKFPSVPIDRLFAAEIVGAGK